MFARASVVLAALLLTGCSSVPHLDEGQVASKEHHDGYYSTYQSCTYVTSGKALIPLCTPITTWVEPTWILHLKNGTKEGVADVDEKTFDQCHEGDWYADKQED